MEYQFQYYGVYSKVLFDTNNVPWYYHSTFLGAPRYLNKYHGSTTQQKSRYFRKYQDTLLKTKGFRSNATEPFLGSPNNLSVNSS